ncbi:hypothetical protein FRB90_008104 [Tulasnella sp. 427]|nr:hypothetical protein FRB90_008104 [Tulasnella sp. 427]
MDAVVPALDDSKPSAYIFWAYSNPSHFSDPARTLPDLQFSSGKNSKLVPIQLGVARGKAICALDRQVEQLFHQLERHRGEDMSEYDRTRPFFARAVIDQMAVTLASSLNDTAYKRQRKPLQGFSKYPSSMKRLLDIVSARRPWDSGFQHRDGPPSHLVQSEVLTNAFDLMMAFRPSAESSKARPSRRKRSPSPPRASSSKRARVDSLEPELDSASLALAPPKKGSNQMVLGFLRADGTVTRPPTPPPRKPQRRTKVESSKTSRKTI